jgi:hypothetical protein
MPLKGIHFKFFIMKRMFYLFFVSMFFNGCNFNREDSFTIKNNLYREVDNNIDTIDIDVKDLGDINLGHIISDIKMSPLEMNDSSIIGKVFKLKYFNKHVYIVDNGRKSLFCFDLKGNFSFKIENIGKGPSEYLKITDFTINHQDSLLIILDFNQKKLLKYHASNGSFVMENKVNSSFPFYNLEFINQDQYVICSNFGYMKGHSMRFNLMIVDKNCNIVSQHIPFDKAWDNYIYSLDGAISYDSLLVYPNIQDHTIYGVDGKNKNVFPRFYFDFKENNIDLSSYKKTKSGNPVESKEHIQSWLRKSEYATGPFNVCETKKHLIYDIIYKQSRFFGFYSKESKKNMLGNNLVWNLGLIEITSSGFLTTIEDKFVISIIYPSDIILRIDKEKNDNMSREQFAKKQNLDELTREIYTKGNINDNPVLILLKLRDF